MIKRLLAMAAGTLVCMSVLFTSATPARASEEPVGYDVATSATGAEPSQFCFIAGVCG